MWIFTGPGKDDNQLINLGNVTRILMEPVEGGKHTPDDHKLCTVADAGSTVIIGPGHLLMMSDAIIDIFDSLATGEWTWSFFEFETH